MTPADWIESDMSYWGRLYELKRRKWLRETIINVALVLLITAAVTYLHFSK